jgi:hypothetical protein
VQVRIAATKFVGPRAKHEKGVETWGDVIDRRVKDERNGADFQKNNPNGSFDPPKFADEKKMGGP